MKTKEDFLEKKNFLVGNGSYFDRTRFSRDTNNSAGSISVPTKSIYQLGRIARTCEREIEMTSARFEPETIYHKTYVFLPRYSIFFPNPLPSLRILVNFSSLMSVSTAEDIIIYEL